MSTPPLSRVDPPGFARTALGEVASPVWGGRTGTANDERVDTVLVMPEVVLDTPRIRLRPFRNRDVAALVDAVDGQVRHWLSMPEPYDADAARRWCVADSHQLRIDGDGQHWVVADRLADRFLGTVGFNRTRWDNGVTEVGYWIAKEARGRGLASEAVRVVSDWALRRLDIRRVELQAAVGNAASRRVADKAGFVREGVLRRAGRHHSRGDAEQRDLECWSLISEDLDRSGAHTVAQPPGRATTSIGGAR